MNYQESLDFILNAVGKGTKNGVENMRRLLARLGDPHRAYPCAHVAGTNGKGSIASMIASGAMARGLRVGLYTSPHLVRYNERMRVDGRCIPDGDLAAVTTRVAEAVEALRADDVRPTFFDISTAVALLYFREAKVDFAVIEVGIGGRYDSTNIIEPLVSVVGRIGLDHVKMLGGTLSSIAQEKAGILKPGVPAVLHAQEPEARAVLLERAAELGCPVDDLSEAGIAGLELSLEGTSFDLAYRGRRRLRTRLAGAHQAGNAATAYFALNTLRGALGLTDAHIRTGLEQARWPGRLEWIDPFLLDGAHNEQGAGALEESLAILWKNEPKPALIAGMMGNKDVSGIVGHLARIAGSEPGRVFTAAVDSHRALPPEALAELFVERGVSAAAMPSIDAAMEAARATGRRILVAGSLYLVGDVRNRLCGEIVDLLP